MTGFYLAYLLTGAVIATATAARLIELRDVVLDDLSPLQCAVGLLMVVLVWPGLIFAMLGGDGKWRG